MKMNNKIIRLKRFAKSICHCERSAAILVAMTIILSLFLVAVPMAGAADTATLEVGPGQTYTTIQSAIDAASSGDIINVAAGTYLETIDIIKDNLTIQSVSGDPADSIIQADAKNKNVVDITSCSNVTFSGFTVKGSETVSDAEVWGVYMDDASSCSVSDMHITAIEVTGSNNNGGLFLDDTTHPNNNNTFIDITITDITGLFNVYGMIVRGGEGNSFTGTEISDITGGSVDAISFNWASDCTFELTTIHDIGDAITTQAVGFYIYGVPSKADNNTFTDTDINNITAAGSTAGILQWFYVSENTFVATTVSNITSETSGAQGIFAFGMNDANTYDDTEISHVTALAGVALGIYFNFPGNSGNAFNTMIITDIEGQTGAAGIYLYEKDSNNAFTSTDISDVTASDGDSYGIKLKYDVTGNSFTGGSITGAQYGVYLLGSADNGDASNNSIYSSDISGNTDYGVLNENVSASFDATNNWWGDASGPTHSSNLDGTGNAVSDNVDYNPWYTDEAMTTLSNKTDINSYKFEAANNADLISDVICTINSTNHTVSLTVPYGTDVTALVATFDLSAGATAKVGETAQVSGTTPNDFSSSVTYTITSLDETTTQNWTVTVTLAAASNVATLSDLTLSEGSLSPTFDPATTNYTAAVTNNITSITVTPTAADTNATIKVNDITVVSGSESDAIDLTVGENTITIIVTAQDETTKTYTVTVTRAASNVATLSDLTVDGTTITGFDSTTLTYNKELPYGTTKVPTVAATPTDSNATKVITQAANVTGTEPERTAMVLVTAEDGTTQKTYKVIFSVAANNVATLSDLTVDGTTITGFDPATLDYSKELPYGTTTVPTVAATPTDSNNATKEITQVANVTGTEEQRTATVVVTAEDGTTQKTYKVIFGSIKVTITKTGPTTANQGDNIIYTITYKNVGTFNATNVVITETYPSEVEYVLATPEPDSGTNNKWTIPTLAPGVEGIVTVTVHIK